MQPCGPVDVGGGIGRADRATACGRRATTSGTVAQRAVLLVLDRGRADANAGGTRLGARHVAELAGLEHTLPDLVAGPGVLHGDLRIDNVLIDHAG
jgi:hypothetical protein